ncbi:hypothetical protein BpHYR1_044456 [Brachionus plicatilis]|uniref:Uncharacterized protein n=1 Tax=Brachionus plicatilis TaxID=10195 RepID=A0A3M7RJK3_BRAPC|nr:hypothetical protein BpHYR1_044456 [Brachionus plicatilis]
MVKVTPKRVPRNNSPLATSSKRAIQEPLQSRVTPKRAIQKKLDYSQSVLEPFTTLDSKRCFTCKILFKDSEFKNSWISCEDCDNCVCYNCWPRAVNQKLLAMLLKFIHTAVAPKAKAGRPAKAKECLAKQ